MNNSASKNTFARRLRDAFTEWEGRAINVVAHKGWGIICAYITKEDPKPIVWGNSP